MIKLSIIVPVYNVAPYLRKCVDSLLAQDYYDYEIILVDDGSPDACPQICDEYARMSQESRVKSQELPCIRVIHQENGGLSAARNTGIKAAKGNYLCFVDSDDYWEPNVLGGLMAQVERENLDVLRFDYQNVRITGEGLTKQYEVIEPYKQPHQVDRQHDVMGGETYLNTRMGYTCYAVMFIVRSNLLLERENRDEDCEKCLFTEGIHFEDVDWLPRMMLLARRVSSTSKLVYNYCVREGSITQEKDDVVKRHRNVKDAIIVIKRLKLLYDSNPSCYWVYNMISITTLAILNTVSCFFYMQRAEYIQQLKGLGVFPLGLSDIGGSYQIKARLCNISPYVGINYLYIINKLMRLRKRNR